MRLLATAAIAAVALSGGMLSAMDNPLPPISYEKHQLTNGLTVILVEDHSVPLAAVNINYMVGSKNERPGRTGFAHLFEHMMFQGSKNWNDDYFKPLQEIGGTVNGGTNTDRTRYWELVPAGYLERALWLEADRMGFLLDAMTPERLANQISVVQNERRQNYENRPYGTVRERVMAVLYPPNHPYSWLTIGSMADLQAATLDDVKGFFRSYYTPNNASLCIAGDIDKANVKALVSKCFGAIPPGPPVARLARWVPEVKGDVVLEIQDRVQLPRSYLYWPTVPIYDADDAALDAFATIVGGGKTSRLYQKLVYEKQIAQDATTSHSSLQIAGAFEMMLTPRPGTSLEDLEKAALVVLTEALEGGVTAAELARTQTAITADFVRGRQNIGGFGGISDKLNEYFHFLGEVDAYRWDLQRYLDLTPEIVTATARRYLRSGRVVAHVRPLAPLASATSEEATKWDRAVMPGKGPENAFKLPQRQHLTLDNGLQVVLVEHHELPLVACDLLVRGGAAADPADRAGLASLTAALLQEGAGGRTSREIAESLEALGANVDVTASGDAVLASLSTLKEKMAESLAIYADVIARPDFPAAELERQRKRRLVQLTQLSDQPAYLAQVASLKAVFGDHPYGHVPSGTRKAIEAITLDDVKGFWKAQFVPANATLIVVGDTTPEELRARLGATLGAWQGGKAPALQLATPRQHGPRTVYLVDKPGAAQSVIVAAQVGVARRTKSYATFEVLNTAFGGQFVSRLNLNLREDKGYTYGARSRFDYGMVPGAFNASAPVQTAVTAPALKEMITELEGIAGARPLTNEELEYARGTIVNGYARRFETPDQIARELVDVVLYGLPDGSLEAFPLEVQAVKADTLASLAKATIVPDHVAIVVVGDEAVVRPELEKLHLGPIVELDREGNPVKPASK